MLVLRYQQLGGNMCEDYPCCGHELGDCGGGLYGSDDSIKQAVYDSMAEEDDWMFDPEW